VSRRGAFACVLALTAAPILGSCAYYNTFYLARKNYDLATAGEPYLVERNAGAATQNFNRSIDYSKKLLAQYPKSGWVDDAYLLWARALLGKDDPRQTVNMLVDFSTRFPKSQLKDEAVFYLGVGYRQSRKSTEALSAFDDFLKQAPKHKLAPYALLERSRVLTTLERPTEAAQAAGSLIERFPKSPLVKQARVARSEALIAQGDFAAARADFRYLGDHALDDEERFTFLLREADALEGARDYEAEIQLLRDALSHEKTPIPGQVGTGTNVQRVAPTGPGVDRWGRLRIRIGTAHLLAGRIDPALVEYKDVIDVYPKNPLAAEAQYRIGYAYETVGDDFERARAEYAKVKDQAGVGGFTLQANSRLANLERIAQVRGATGRDSLEKRAEAGFLLAEQYLFQLDKPERALEEYTRLANTWAGTPYAGKAYNAKAWVLSRKLSRKAEADSLFWKVVREYPATEAQLAARDYLEGEGITVPADLIKMPVEKRDTLAADSLHLTAPPLTVPRLGSAPGVADSMLRLGAPRPGSASAEAEARRQAMLDARERMTMTGASPDSMRRAMAALVDSLRRERERAMRDSSQAAPDSSARSRDSSGTKP
jgi:TolA-binding protein